MRDVIAQTSNVRRLVTAAHTMINRSRGMPGIAIVSGEVGLGKTTATQHVCLIEDAIWVRALPDWTARWMTADIAQELGCERAYSTEKNYRAILGALRERPRALFIDESNHLVRHLQQAETLRAIHDATSAPIILVGDDKLARAIHILPQLESRVAHWVQFLPCDLRDARAMAEQLCEIELEDDLLKELHRVTGGSARSIRIALERLENLAHRRVKRKLALDDLPEGFALTYARRSKTSPLAPLPVTGEGNQAERGPKEAAA